MQEAASVQEASQAAEQIATAGNTAQPSAADAAAERVKQLQAESSGLRERFMSATSSGSVVKSMSATLPAAS